MASIPELLLQFGPFWHAAFAIAGAAIWLLAVRRVIRDMGRSTAIPAKFARPVATASRQVVRISAARRRRAA